MKPGLTLSATFLLLAGTSTAATLHVATTGSDAPPANGTESAPWATITHALDNASDGDTILVEPGTYTGQIRLRGRFDTPVTVRSRIPWQARLRHDAAVVICYYGKGIIFEHFDVAHGGPGASPLVFQIQNLNGEDEPVTNIIVRHNVLHDSYNNDILKINNGARNIEVHGNLFYNHGNSDEHIDVNSVDNVHIHGNIFMSDFPGSGRPITGSASSFIVVKDSNGDDDAYIGTRNVTIERNVFLNWEGSPGSNFLLIGEDGHPYYESYDILVQNNLMIGNSNTAMRSAFGVKGSRDIVFRHNTIVGNLPANEFAMRLNTEGDNQIVRNVAFHNNIWSDPTGTMNRFSRAAPAETDNISINRNLYWNGGSAIPSDNAQVINHTDDTTAVLGDPLLGAQENIALPRWNPETGTFGDGSTTIHEAFERLVNLYGTPAEGSPAINAANSANSPTTDILGRPRTIGAAPDLGAVETGIAPTAAQTMFLVY